MTVDDLKLAFKLQVQNLIDMTAQRNKLKAKLDKMEKLVNQETIALVKLYQVEPDVEPNDADFDFELPLEIKHRGMKIEIQEDWYEFDFNDFAQLVRVSQDKCVALDDL